MPTERSPTPLSHTAISVENSSEDRNSEGSGSIATIEIIKCEGEPTIGTPSENTENMEFESVSRHRTPTETSSQKFTSYDIPELTLERKRSSGISKGVILNAMNFGSYDLKCTPNELKEKPALSKDEDLCENGSLSPKALEASTEKDQNATEDGEKKEKKKMSLPRKIAFGFSFLPSVMFVLTFAVILPCDDYKNPGTCAKNAWSVRLNNTEITSNLGLPQTLLLGYHAVNSTGTFQGLLNLNNATGKEIWRLPLWSDPKLLACVDDKVSEETSTKCLTVLEDGDVCAFNISDGDKLWTYSTGEPNDGTVLLPGCSYYKGLKPVTVVKYNSKENTLNIYVLSSTDGTKLATKQIKLPNKCFTFSMKSWIHDNETDLVFYCEDILDLGYISLVRQSFWCSDSEEVSLNGLQELMRFSGNEAEPIYLPTAEGVLVWTNADVTFLKSEGTVKWRGTPSYIPQKRTAQFGFFYSSEEQVALIGQNASFGVVVSIVSSESGEELNTFSIPDRTLNEAVVLNENQSASLLISVLKINATETGESSDNDVVLISNVSTTLDFRTDVKYKSSSNTSITEELVLLQFEGKNTTDVVFESEIPMSCQNVGICEPENQPCHIISAFSEEKDSSLNLKIVLLKTADNLKQNGSQPYSQLMALDIMLQDGSDKEATSCTL